MPDLPDATVAHLAAQHGVISLAQCRAAGLTDSQVRNLTRSGRWERLAPGVYAVSLHRTTWVRKLWIAHLHAGPDSVVSHESAGRLHRYTQVPAGRVVLMTGRNCRYGPDGVRLHRADDLCPDDVTKFDGLPVTKPLRTIVDLAGVLRIAPIRSLVDDVVTSKRFTLAEIGAAMDALRRRGKPGIALLSRVLDDQGPGDGMSRSELERLLDEVILLSGLPRPVHEYPLPGRGAMTGFVDRCWPEARLIVEADGRKWHTRREQMRRDASRSLEASAAGFETTRLLWEHLTHDPDGTASLLRAVYEQRRALLRRGAS